MILSEIIQAALEDLNRDIDQQNREEYESRLIRHINDGYRDLIDTMCPQSKSEVELDENGLFSMSALPDARDVTGVMAGGAPCAFMRVDGDRVRVLGAGKAGKVVAVYNLAAPPMRSQSDTPKYLPIEFHSALVDFAVYCELMTGSTQRQARAMAFRERYDSQKARLYAMSARGARGHAVGGGFLFGGRARG